MTLNGHAVDRLTEELTDFLITHRGRAIMTEEAAILMHATMLRDALVGRRAKIPPPPETGDPA